MAIAPVREERLTAAPPAGAIVEARSVDKRYDTGKLQVTPCAA